MDEDKLLLWLVDVHFSRLTISFISHFTYISTFHYPLQFVVKMEHFHYVSVENCMQKYGQEGVCLFVFRLTYVEPKHQSDLT